MNCIVNRWSNRDRHAQRATLTLVMFVAVTFTVQSQGAVIVTIGDINLSPGGTGTIDLNIEGDSNLVQLFGFEVRITPDAGTTSSLKFLEEDEAYLTNSSYLFVGNSGAQDDTVASTVGSVSTDTLPSDTFIGGDFTSDFTDVSVTTEKLLAQLIVEHEFSPAAPETTIGNSFTISLIPASGDSSDFALGSSNTGFLDSSFGEISFSSSSGTVTITAQDNQENSVPEPTSMLLLITALFLATSRRSRNRNHTA